MCERSMYSVLQRYFSISLRSPYERIGNRMLVNCRSQNSITLGERQSHKMNSGPCWQGYSGHTFNNPASMMAEIWRRLLPANAIREHRTPTKSVLNAEIGLETIAISLQEYSSAPIALNLMFGFSNFL